MKRWQKTIVGPDTTIRDTIGVIDESALQIALVLDADRKLLGTITDGDIRRGILKGVPLTGPARSIMNATPVVAMTNDSRDTILATMRSRKIHQIPVVDGHGTLVGVEFLDELLQPVKRENTVVLMAGGLGTRLMPLTNDCPKPLLKIGSKPILEIILENFIDQGFCKFFISVNYKAEMIESHFGDGSRWGVEIDYLRETERMGTAGALSLLPGSIAQPLLVMNADLLTKVNFGHLLNFHTEHNAKATLCVRDYDYQIPYGVVRIDKHRLTAIEEKPVHQCFVNAGIYVLEPETLLLLPRNTFFDMPSLLCKLIEHQHETAVFPVREYWMDIGRMSDFEQANYEYNQGF
ncbi:nucleotidyltransferase family protein [Geomonas nitrogeniifigens]|uniref:Nucleotidyltransferase family protein n=1 Tax=Geomonas diazotrophica TaxID=2843197 RepID=A0ABX8JER8_9BACT|nr:nucleotidyltransferase family protein [Geomonas nitrogeniifigens]QWV95972.1 nucleotidyltransferase family protein [Geomonas nitrogeniifigens]